MSDPHTVTGSGWGWGVGMGGGSRGLPDAGPASRGEKNRVGEEPLPR